MTFFSPNFLRRTLSKSLNVSMIFTASESSKQRRTTGENINSKESTFLTRKVRGKTLHFIPASAIPTKDS